MTSITIIGSGNMGSAIAGIATTAGAEVQVIARDAEKEAALSSITGSVGEALTGDIVVLAVPYSALDELLATYGSQLDGKIVVDLTNPVDMATFDSLVVPADSSAAAQIADKLPRAKVLKAFNTTFAGTLATGTVGGDTTTVLVAGDDADAKAALIDLVRAGGLNAADAGSLQRARELEALGFLQISLAATEKISWMGGFALTK